MPCYCDLLPTVERLHGKVTPELALRLQIAEAANKDDVAFEDHMLLEEKYIIPYIKNKSNKDYILQTHKEFRSYRKNKLPIPEDKFQFHASFEKKIFGSLGWG
jgi:hypothetical protein